MNFGTQNKAKKKMGISTQVTQSMISWNYCRPRSVEWAREEMQKKCEYIR